jgi:hypothetical protein
MKQRTICKTLAVTVILLFIGVGINPAIATVEPETEFDDVPKDYLFQTIIDIANNPDVKELLEQYYNDFFSVDIDRSVYCKLLLRNPRLMFNILFTKPSISVEYLNKCYNNGVEITNIISEEKTYEIIVNVKVFDTKLLEELNDVISKDENFYNRFETLKEMSKELNPTTHFMDHPIICAILFITLIPFNFCLHEIILISHNFENEKNPILKIILYTLLLPLATLVYIQALILIYILECIG